MRGVVDDLLALPGQVIADQRTQLANAAAGVANQAIASGIAKAKDTALQVSRTTIANAVVAAVLVAAIIAAGKLAWSYHHGR